MCDASPQPIVVRDCIRGGRQSLYHFANGYGASVIVGGRVPAGIAEVAVIRSVSGTWSPYDRPTMVDDGAVLADLLGEIAEL
jgi:hypothetical protein